MADEQTTDAAEATTYTKAEQAHYEAIRKKEREVGKLAIVAADAKQEASATKKAFDAADEKLRELIRGGPDLQQQLPGMEDDGKSSSAWRELELSDMGIDGTLIGKLHKSEITTMGELSSFIAEHGPQWSRDLLGVGEVTGGVIQELYVKFWATHPEYCETPPDKSAESSNARIQIKLTRDIINELDGELDDKLAAAGEMLTTATDTHGNPYLVDPADGEHVYLEPEDYEVVG